MTPVHRYIWMPFLLFAGVAIATMNSPTSEGFPITQVLGTWSAKCTNRNGDGDRGRGDQFQQYSAVTQVTISEDALHKLNFDVRTASGEPLQDYSDFSFTMVVEGYERNPFDYLQVENTAQEFLNHQYECSEFDARRSQWMNSLSCKMSGHKRDITRSLRMISNGHLVYRLSYDFEDFSAKDSIRCDLTNEMR